MGWYNPIFIKKWCSKVEISILYAPFLNGAVQFIAHTKINSVILDCKSTFALLFSSPTINIGRDWGENYVFCAMFEEVLSYSLCTLAANTVFFVSFLVPLTREIYTSLKKKFTNRFRIFFWSRSWSWKDL